MGLDGCHSIHAVQVHPGLTSWGIFSRPFGTDLGRGVWTQDLRPGLLSAVPSGLIAVGLIAVAGRPRTHVLGYFQPSPSTSSHGTPGQAGQALRDWSQYPLIGDWSLACDLQPGRVEKKSGQDWLRISQDTVLGIFTSVCEIHQTLQFSRRHGWPYRPDSVGLLCR
jgi:hypothetical protein